GSPRLRLRLVPRPRDVRRLALRDCRLAGGHMGIDRKRLERSIDDLGRIGETPRGGLTRLALTDEDKRGRDWMVARMREAGLRVTMDQMGNIFGERPGAEPLPPVLIGSHVDSVPTGGKYDGQLGVLCGLETIRTLNDHRIRTRHPVALVIFTNEEGARFQPAMIASGVMAGKIALEDAYNARDKDGIRSVDEPERIGYLGSEPCVPRPLRAYLELHIEQAPLLEEAGLSGRVVAEVACEREGVRYELEHYWRVPYTPFAPDVVATIERAANAAGARWRHILSGAGHDAQYMAAIGPAGMIFVPSRDGRSHCEEE